MVANVGVCRAGWQLDGRFAVFDRRDRLGGTRRNQEGSCVGLWSRFGTVSQDSMALWRPDSVMGDEDLVAATLWELSGTSEH